MNIKLEHVFGDVWAVKAEYIDPGNGNMRETTITEFKASEEEAHKYFDFFMLGQKFPV